MSQHQPEHEPPKYRFKENVEHFYEYYRYHVLFAVFLVIVTGYITHTVIENRREQAELAKLPPPAVTVMFFGDIPMFMENEPLEDYMLQLFPDWNRTKAIVAYAPTEFKTELEFAMLQRSVATMAVEYADLYVMDEHNFQIYAPQGYFMALDEFEADLLQYAGEERLVHVRSEDKEKTAIYGVNIRGSDWFSYPQMSDKNMIAAIRTNVENEENALALIRKLLEELNHHHP